MASTKVSDRYPPNIDVTKSSIAYEDRALPKLVRPFVSKAMIDGFRAENSKAAMTQND